MNLATIGTSAITRMMIDHSRELENLHLIASYSRDLKKAEVFAAEFGMKKAYDNLDAMFADPEIDTVYIASPNTLHYPQARKALEAGKNVILEKPFASTQEQAQDLFETAEKNGVMIFEAITNIHTPNFGLLRDQLSMAGQIREAVLNFSQYSSRYDKYKMGIVENAFDPQKDGGALTDINIYNIHLINALFGRPVSVSYYPVFGFNGIDTSGVLILQYPDFVATCIASKDSSAPSVATIQGDAGTFVIDEAAVGIMKHVQFQPVHKGEEPLEISIDQGPHMTYEMMDFMTAIDEKDHEMYRQYKAETLDAMAILEEAKKQRDTVATAAIKAN